MGHASSRMTLSNACEGGGACSHQSARAGQAQAGRQAAALPPPACACHTHLQLLADHLVGVAHDQRLDHLTLLEHVRHVAIPGQQQQQQQQQQQGKLAGCSRQVVAGKRDEAVAGSSADCGQAVARSCHTTSVMPGVVGSLL